MASISKPVNGGHSESSAPRYQVIQSTPASLYRKDFGLKRAMPAGAKTPLITVQALDTMYGMTAYEFGSSFHFKARRFQEMGVSIVSTANNSLFEQPTTKKYWKDLSRSEAIDLLKKAQLERPKFLKSLQSNPLDDKFQNKKSKLHSSVDKFYDIHDNPVSIQASRGAAKGNAGLSYTLSGSVMNTPTGPIFYRAVQGRDVSLSKGPASNGGSNSSAAVGGFIAAKQKVSSSNGSNNLFYVRDAMFDSNGGIQLRVRSTQDDLSSGQSTLASIRKPQDNKSSALGTYMNVVENKKAE